jgi:hypothetical protein
VIPSSGVRTDFIGCHYITYNSDRFPVGSDEIRLSGWWTWVYANLGPRWSHYLVCKFQELLTFLYPRFWPRSYSQVTLVATTRLTLDWFPSVYLPPVLVEFYFKLSSNKHACTKLYNIAINDYFCERNRFFQFLSRSVKVNDKKYLTVNRRLPRGPSSSTVRFS